jgi:hypothetical protein
MTVKVTNNGFSTLSAGITDSATTITLASGEGSRFPNPSSPDVFYATLIDTSNNLEIVKVTARSTDSLTVVRAQDNTSARAFSAGDRFELRPVAKLFEDIQAEARDLNGAELVLDADGDTSIHASTDDQIDFKTGGTDRMHIDSSGNVGIGTSSPSSPLEVVGGAPLASGFTQSRSGHPTFGITNGGTDSIYFHLAPSGGSHQTFMQVRDDGTDVDSIAFSTSGTEAMRIDSSGRVGIGTSSPDQNLHVSDTSSNAYIKIISNDSNTAGILLGDQNSGLQGKIYYVNSGDYMRFDTNGSERMRIDSDGFLGIGVTTTQAHLHVDSEDVGH